MRGAVLWLVLAGCLPEYEEAAPACAAGEVVVHRAVRVYECLPRPTACALPETCVDGACVIAMLALCDDPPEAVVTCGDQAIVTEVVCGQ